MVAYAFCRLLCSKVSALLTVGFVNHSTVRVNALQVAAQTLRHSLQGWSEDTSLTIQDSADCCCPDCMCMAHKQEAFGEAGTR